MMDFLWSGKQSPFRLWDKGWLSDFCKKALFYLMRTAGTRNEQLQISLLWLTLLKCLHAGGWVLDVALRDSEFRI